MTRFSLGYSPTLIGSMLLVVLIYQVVMRAKRRRLDRIAPEEREPGRYADAYVRRSRWGRASEMLPGRGWWSGGKPLVRGGVLPADRGSAGRLVLEIRR